MTDAIFDEAAKACSDLTAAYGKRQRDQSAHSKFEEKHYYTTAVKSLKAVRDHWRQLLPAHWDMNGWGIYLTTKGDSLRWSAGEGKSTKGLTIKTDADSLKFATGFLQVMGNAHTTPFKKDVAALDQLGITDTSSFLFMLPARHRMGPPRNVIHVSDGLSPVDAYANLVVRGGQHDTIKAQARSTNRPFDDGMRIAKDRLMKDGRDWSGALALYDRLTQNPAFMKLLRSNRQRTKQRLDLINSYRFYSYADALLTVEKTIQACVTQDPPRTLKPYIVVDRHQTGDIIKAWDGDSALIGKRIVDLMVKEAHPIASSRSWKAYPLTEDATGKAQALL